jgi:hypothetical protein
LSLWNAELKGTVKTSAGAYDIHALVHSQNKSFYVNIVPRHAVGWERVYASASLDCVGWSVGHGC